MSWILKQAEDILNRVDQQTNAAITQHNLRSNTQTSADEQSNDGSSLLSRTTDNAYANNRSSVGNNRRSKKQQEADLLDYLNSSSTPSKKTNRSTASSSQLSDSNRTASTPNMANTDTPTSFHDHSASKSASVTPRSTTPAATSSDEDQGLVFDIPSIEQVTQDFTAAKNSTDSNMKDDIINSLHSEIQILMRDKRNHEQDLQNYKRQQILYQQQISESDALLRDLRAREADSLEALSAKDSQIALLRVRLAESDELFKSKTALCEQLQSQCARILQDHTDASGLQSQAFDSLQARLNQAEQDVQQKVYELERINEEKQLTEKRANEEKQQLLEQVKLAEKRLHDERSQFQEQQQQAKHNKTLVHQLEQDMQEYKAKAQRILQTKDKLIEKLKEMAQNRNSSVSSTDALDAENVSTNEDGNVVDPSISSNSLITSSGSNMHTPWSNVQYEELKFENELFKQELQAREFTINGLRNELHEAELLVQHAEEQLREQTDQLNEQLKDEKARLMLAEQDCRKLKQELAYLNDDFHRQKQVHLSQLNERERELERLRLQLTAKTINHVNDEELEKRLQTLTESLIHKQTIIEALQTEKSSLTMQLERLEKRLEDYERIATANMNNASGSGSTSSSKRLQATTIQMDTDGGNMYDNDHDDNLRYRLPILRETPYDPDIAKKMKRAANEIDRLGIRLGIFLKRYPAVRLGVIFYAILLHLWTLIVLFTYKPEIHGNLHSSLDSPHIS